MKGEPICLRSSTRPATVSELDEIEARRSADRERADDERAWREEERTRFALSQPQRVVTLADLLGRDLPTIAVAAQEILDAGGRIEERDGRLRICLPERLSESASEDERLREPLLDCVRVLVASREIVLASLQSRSKKELAERLPARDVAADGGLAT